MTKNIFCNDCFEELDHDPGYKVHTDRFKRESDRVWYPGVGVMKALRAVCRYERAYYKQCQQPRNPDEERDVNNDNEEEEEEEEDHVCDEKCWEEDCFGDFDFSMCIHTPAKRVNGEDDDEVQETAGKDGNGDDSNSNDKKMQVQTADESQKSGLEVDRKGDNQERNILKRKLGKHTDQAASTATGESA
jgi:hypothetical protein